MGYVYRGKQPIIKKQAPIPHPGSVLEPCGTIGAAFRHWKAGEKPCEPCREARRAYDREYKRRRRAANPPAPKPRKSQPCGTRAAAQRHYSRGEPMCEPCRLAKLAYEKQIRDRAPKKERPVAKCGTYTGYARHRRLGEKACRPCLEAWNERGRGQRMTAGVPNGTIQPTQQKAAA